MSLLDRLIVAGLPLVPRPVVRRFSRPYIAGPEIADAVRVTRQVNGQGACATLDVLGEYVRTEEDAWAAAKIYRDVLDAIEEHRLDANISIKLTQLGLKITRETCEKVVASLLEAAAEKGRFVRIDMEDSSCTTDTIELYGSLRGRFDNMGLVLQSCLRRTLDDLRHLAPGRPNLRLCKGIYIEPRAISWRDPEIIRSNYVLLLEEMLRAGCYVGIATHDERLVWEAQRLIHKLEVPADRFEFQMLLGVDEPLRRILLDAGYKVRIYIPFGRQWYAYSLRRLKENPRIAGYVFRGLLART